MSRVARNQSERTDPRNLPQGRSMAKISWLPLLSWALKQKCKSEYEILSLAAHVNEMHTLGQEVPTKDLG